MWIILLWMSQHRWHHKGVLDVSTHGIMIASENVELFTAALQTKSISSQNASCEASVFGCVRFCVHYKSPDSKFAVC